MPPSALSIECVRISSRAELAASAERLVLAHSRHGPGHRLGFAEVERALGHADHSLVALKDGEVVGFAPAFLLEEPVLRMFTRRTLAGGSLVAAAPLVSEQLSRRDKELVLEALVAQLRLRCPRDRVDRVQYIYSSIAGESPSFATDGPLELMSHGFSLGVIPGPVVSLSQPAEAIFASMSATTRNLLRRCEREGVSCGTLSKREQWRAFWPLIGQALPGRARAQQALDVIVDQLIPAELCHGLVAYVTGEAVSAVVTTESNGCAYYLLAFNTEEGLLRNANRYLLWQSMLAARDRGCRFFQLGSLEFGESKSARISAFKRQFGGNVQLSPVASWCARPLRASALELVSKIAARRPRLFVG